MPSETVKLGHLISAAAIRTVAVRRLYELGQKADLSDRQAERVHDALSKVSSQRLSQADVPITAFVTRLIEELSSHNWYVQNPAAEMIHRAGPADLAPVDADLLRTLGSNVTQAAEGTAGDAVELVHRIPELGEWPAPFIAGVVLEAFVHESGEIRFKGRHLQPVVRTLSALSRGDQTAVVDEVVAEIEGGHPREPWRFDRDLEANCEAIREEAEDLPELARLSAALEAVELNPDELPLFAKRSFADGGRTGGDSAPDDR